MFRYSFKPFWNNRQTSQRTTFKFAVHGYRTPHTEKCMSIYAFDIDNGHVVIICASAPTPNDNAMDTVRHFSIANATGWHNKLAKEIVRPPHFTALYHWRWHINSLKGYSISRHYRPSCHFKLNKNSAVLTTFPKVKAQYSVNRESMWTTSLPMQYSAFYLYVEYRLQ